MGIRAKVWASGYGFGVSQDFGIRARNWTSWIGVQRPGEDSGILAGIWAYELGIGRLG